MTPPYWPDLDSDKMNMFIKALKINPDYILLAEYAELKKRGLRKQAYKKLDEFIALARSFTEVKKRELIRLICQEYEHIYYELGHWNFNTNFGTYPLTNKIILPTLKQWIEDEPQNPEPLKWLGLFYYNHIGYDVNDGEYFTALERCLALNPQDDKVRKILILRYLNHLDSSIEDVIDYSFYKGDPSEDLKLCSIIEDHFKNLQDKNIHITLSEWLEEYRYLKNLQDKDIHITLTEELKEYRHIIQDWQQYVKENVKMSFSQWFSLKNSFD